jgi:cytochrome b involved in lipid metabolism
MKKIILIVLILFIVLVSVVFLYFKKFSSEDESTEYLNSNQNASQNINNENKIDNNLTTSSEKNLQNQLVKKTYSFEEVQTHNSKQSCWSAIRGKVYDLTSWISNHPGGEKAILSICGKDGTEAFVNQHGGKNKPEKALSQFEIGELQN